MFKEKWEEDYKRPLLQNAGNPERLFMPAENEYLKVSGFSCSAPEGATSITYESGLQFRMEIEKKQENLVLHPAIRIFDYLMNMILMIMPQANSDTDRDLRAHKDTVGKIRFDAALPPQILTFGNYYAELIFAKNVTIDSGIKEEAIKLPTKIHFEVKQGLIFDYAGGTDNISIKPQCNWEITMPDNTKEAQTN